MQIPSESEALKFVVEQLAVLLDVPRPAIGRETDRQARALGLDALLTVGPMRLAVKWKGSNHSAAVRQAADTVRRVLAEAGEDALPLMVVPHMGQQGHAYCQVVDVSWMDLSGNAYLVAPGVRVIIEGRPNRFKAAGRPENLFAPKSARIARWLLMHPQTAWTQSALAKAVNLGEPFVSRIVHRLEADHLIQRDDRGAVRVVEPSRLLDLWSERYDFFGHEVIRGHVPAGSGEALMDTIGALLEGPWAVTGLAAAWLWTHFGGFRLVTVYVDRLPPVAALKRLSFHEEPGGANLWWVIPKDEGVWHGATARAGIRCVHPVQAWLDLKGLPERSAEAAAELERCLPWKAMPGTDKP